MLNEPLFPSLSYACTALHNGGPTTMEIAHIRGWVGSPNRIRNHLHPTTGPGAAFHGNSTPAPVFHRAQQDQNNNPRSLHHVG